MQKAHAHRLAACVDELAPIMDLFQEALAPRMDLIWL